jgi:hypothetical protein
MQAVVLLSAVKCWTTEAPVNVCRKKGVSSSAQGSCDARSNNSNNKKEDIDEWDGKESKKAVENGIARDSGFRFSPRYILTHDVSETPALCGGDHHAHRWRNSSAFFLTRRSFSFSEQARDGK